MLVTSILAIIVVIGRRLGELVPHVVIASLLLIDGAIRTVTCLMPTSTHTALRLELAIRQLATHGT